MKPVSYYHARRAKKLYALVNAMARVDPTSTGLKDFANLANALAVAIEVEANDTVMQLIKRMRRKLTAIDGGDNTVVAAFLTDARAFLNNVAKDVKYAEA